MQVLSSNTCHRGSLDDTVGVVLSLRMSLGDPVFLVLVPIYERFPSNPW